MLTSPIIPAVIPTSLADLQQSLVKLSGLPELHLDVVDGLFVPFTSWPYHENASPKLAKELLDVFSLEVDLMVNDPLTAGGDWLLAGADQLVFHVETISLVAFKDFADNTNLTVGISANNDTDFAILREYLAVADYVQVMGIKTIGSQGQPFDARALDRISLLRSDFPTLPISIDGSVNAETLPMLAKLKLNRYIVGSAIIKQTDPILAYKTLTDSLFN